MESDIYQWSLRNKITEENHMLDQIKIIHEISVEDFLSLRQMVNFQTLQKNEAKCILEHTTYISLVYVLSITITSLFSVNKHQN